MSRQHRRQTRRQRRWRSLFKGVEVRRHYLGQAIARRFPSQPSRLVSGTRMTVRIPDEADRATIIGYLENRHPIEEKPS